MNSSWVPRPKPSAMLDITDSEESLIWTTRRWSLAKAKRHPARSTRFVVEVQNGNLVVSLPGGGFTAVYYRTLRRPHLSLRERTKTDDQELLAEALQAAIAKARELGWIA